MSRLDKLIEKLCPDGAEFLTLQECTQKVKNIKWKSYSGNDKKYIDLSSVDRDLHCIMETQNINSDSAPSRAQQIVHACRRERHSRLICWRSWRMMIS